MNLNRKINPNAFCEFKFRQWKQSEFARAGVWFDDYKKMTNWQKFLFHVSGRIPEQFKTRFQIYLDMEEVKE